MLAMLLLLATAPAGPSVAGSRLAVIRPAPEFTLTDQAGRTVRLSDLRGKVLLVSFVFTTCTGSCPATTQRLCLVQQELQRRGLLEKDRVRLLSVTLDPERDRPEVLRDYMQLHEANPSVWSFLTGPPDQVNKVVSDWGMWVKPAPNGQLDHPSRIFLVDRQGRIREVYNLGFLRPRWVVEDVALLLAEPIPR